MNDEQIELKPCPFCGWKNIRIMEDKRGMLEAECTYCWCRACGTQGPWAFSVNDDMETVIKKCAERWNERDGFDGVKRTDCKDLGIKT